MVGQFGTSERCPLKPAEVLIRSGSFAHMRSAVVHR